MADETYKIVSITERLSNDAAGNLIPVYRVEFVVGKQGPFVEEFEKEKFSHEAVREMVGARARAVRELMPEA